MDIACHALDQMSLFPAKISSGNFYSVNIPVLNVWLFSAFSNKRKLMHNCIQNNINPPT
jgi:hypothetical protein